MTPRLCMCPSAVVASLALVGALLIGLVEAYSRHSQHRSRYWSDETCGTFVVARRHTRTSTSLNLASDYFDDVSDSRRIDRWPYNKEKDGDALGKQYDVGWAGNHPSYEDINKIEWELCEDASTWVVLPPSFVERPNAIIHFVGGTFFGSSPNMWYKTLLDGIVKTTNACVVATGIPVTLLDNPLDHVKIARQLQRQFHMALTQVVQDEYGDHYMDRRTPIIGMGHSLGARLLVVLSTLYKKDKHLDYDAFILMAFTNFGAAASIPGVQSLLEERRQLNERRMSEDYLYGRGYDEYDYDKDELQELFDNLQDSVNEQIAEIKEVLTPHEESMEFYPSPGELWGALNDAQRYYIPNTLLCTFDDDDVCQCARLAGSIQNITDLHYCRLSGGHLTPLNADGSYQGDLTSPLAAIPSTISKAVWKLLRGERDADKTRRRRQREDNVSGQLLRQSISRYITDVIVAPNAEEPTN